MSLRTIVPIVALTALLLVPAAGGVARPTTTEPEEIIDIHVNITDTRIKLSQTRMQRGNVVRFFVRNLGRKPHDFTWGELNVGYITTGPLAPRKGRKTLLAFMDYQGTFPYISNLPADRNKPGMRGQFTIY